MPEPIDAEQLVAIIEQELSSADGADAGELAGVREAALRYYYNEPMGNEVAGRSQAQSTDLADMVEAVVAQMLPAFGGDAPAKFSPNSEQDEDQAALESAFVNDQVMAVNEGYVLIQEAVKDALLQMNGVIKVWVEERKTTATHKVFGVSDAALVDVLTPETESEQLDLVEQEVTAAGTQDVTVRRTTTAQELRLHAVAPENWRFQAGWNRITLDGIRFCAEREYVTRSALIEDGYDAAVVETLKPTTMLSSGQQTARAPGANTSSMGGKEPSTELIEKWDCYWLGDQDGDGIAERHRIIYAGTSGTGTGGAILEDVEAVGVPYAAGVALIRPHQFSGISLFEKLKQTQDVKTDALRQWLDNMRTMNNRRIAYRDGAVDTTSLYTSKPGGGVPCRDPHADLNPIPVDDIGPSILMLLNYMDGTRTEQAGASLDFIDAEAQIAGTSGVAIESQYARKEMLAAMMSQNIAKTLIKETYLLVHRTMRVHLRAPISMRTAAGAWVESTPSDWVGRSRVKVKAGLSAGERAANIAALDKTIEQQVGALSQGMSGQLTDPARVYQSVVDRGYAAMLDNPEQYWIDPASPPAQQAKATADQAATAGAESVRDLQLKLADMQVSFEKYKTDEELRFKYWEQEQKTDIEQAKLIQKDGADDDDNRTALATALIQQRGDNERAKNNGAE